MVLWFYKVGDMNYLWLAMLRTPRIKVFEFYACMMVANIFTFFEDNQQAIL